MSMHHPEKYEKCISFQKRDALHCLQKFESKINWKQNASIIDLGSGDGFITNILKKHLPSDFKKLVGVDISKEMVEYANAKYLDDKTSFVQMDLTGVVPQDFIGAFDHAFSSYAIMFIPDQEKVFSNIFKVLNEGGSCLLLFFGHMLFLDPYIELAKQNKWRTWLKGVNNIVSRYYNMKDAAAIEVERLMKEAGFKNIHAEAQEVSFEYKSYGDLRNLVEAGNFLNLPPDTLKEFMEDYDKIWVNCVEKVNGKSTNTLKYTRIMAYGTK